MRLIFGDEMTLVARLASDRVAMVKGVVALVLFALAVTTPGLLSATSMRSLLTTMSFVGCVAVGMTFITLSGNIMSFSIGASVGVASIVFVSTLSLGVGWAILIAMVLGAAVNTAQGWIIGYFGANPIIVTLAAYALMVGGMNYFTQGRGIYPRGNEADILLTNVGPIPGPLAVFIIVAIIGQLILSYTKIGRLHYYVGSNKRAAKAAGIEPWQTTVCAFALAGLFSAAAAILLAARYKSGDIRHGEGMDYQAISAVLVGGTAIGGGSGSVLRSLIGTLVIAVIQATLLLRGFSTELQQLLIGALVLLVICLQWKSGS
jgi:ribose/xylose/arabinose/galactoside ABC-type transport system permease subunit